MDKSGTINRTKNDATLGITDFINPSIIKTQNNSYLKLNQGNNIFVKNRSTLVIDSNSTLEIFNGAKVVVDSSATLIIRPNATVIVHDGGEILFKDGAFACISSQANIELQEEGRINISDNASMGVNDYAQYRGYGNTCSDWEDISHIGCGYITLYMDTTTKQSYQVWNTSRVLDKDFTVRAGDTLVISNTEVSLCYDNKIIVEPTAKLVINNTTLTNYKKSSTCADRYWTGIVVEGNNNLPQTESNQGVLELNNATIENANIAVTTIGNNYEWSKTGGIIQAKNSVFRNNNKSVEFMSYYNIAANGDTLDNESYFTNCTFTWDTAMIDPEDGYINSHVTMWQVKAVDFTACTFKDERDYRPSLEHTTQGILTNESSYNIKANPIWVQDFNGNNIYFANPTRFNNLTYGIRTGSAYTLPCTVERSEFNNNYCGIFATNTYALTATNNTFNLIPQQGYSGNWTDMQAIGISMQRSRHFTISNNDFMGQNKANKTAGIQIDNISFDVPLNQTVPTSTSFDEVINNNKFNKVFIGIESLGRNYIQKNLTSAGGIMPTITLYDGLTAKCNMFENTKYALYITKQTNTNSPAIVGGMKQNQGSSLSPVNNEFSNTDTSIYNYDGINLTYWNNSSMFLPPYSSHVIVQTTSNSGNGCGAKGVTSEMPVIPPIFPPIVLNSLINMNVGYTLSSDEQETEDNQLWDSYLKQYGSSYNIPIEILLELSEHETAVGLIATEMLYFKGVITNYHPAVIFDGKETTPDKREVISKNDIVITPNPTKDNIVVSYNFADDGEYQFIVLDSKGIVLMKEVLQGKTGEKLINLRNFESGIYFYKITDKDKTLKTDRVIIAE